MNPNALQLLGYGLTLGYTDATGLWNTQHPSIQAQFTVGPIPQKFLTLVAAGSPPDVVMLPPAGGTLDMAVQGILRPLDAYTQKAKISPDDFFLPAWNSQIYQGKVYALPNEVDPNNPLVVNKKPLQEVGIDTIPATIQELKDACAKVLQAKNGEVQRVGLEPPWNRGNADRVTFWFGIFGGSFVDPKDHTKLDLLQPNDVAATNWMKEFADLNGGFAALKAFIANQLPGAKRLAAQADGLLPMQFLVASQAAQVLQGMQKNGSADAFALALPPSAPGVPPDPAWLGGWDFALPTGTKRPDDAWNLAAWMCASADGTDAWAEKNRFLPGYKKSTFYARNANDIITQGYLKVLEGAKRVEPNFGTAPDAIFDTLFTSVASGQVAVNTALETCQEAFAPSWNPAVQPQGVF